MACVSGSPRRTLNSITFGPAGREHQADEQEAAKGMPLFRHPGDHRLDDLAHHALDKRRVNQGARRKSAHPAGIRSAILVEYPLVILRPSERHRTFAV